MIIAGIDEAGRGPVIGPMVMAVAVIRKGDEDLLREIGVRDSKQLSAEQRSSMLPAIRKALLEQSTVQIAAESIDSMRSRRSLNEIEAMHAAQLLNGLSHRPDIVYIDSPDPVEKSFAERLGKYLSYKCILRAEHKADVNYPVVSAASIIAKVERDSEITKLEGSYGRIGSGYSHDPDTISFIKDYMQKNNSLPPCARKSWLTAQRLEDCKAQKKIGGDW